MPIKPVRDEFVIADDITLHYVQWGEQGPAIVCLHGVTANALCFQSLADEMANDHPLLLMETTWRL